MNNWPSTTLPSVKDCTRGNCAYGFPQFRPLNHIEWRADLAKYLPESKPEHKDLYAQAIALLDLNTHEGIFRACEIAGKAWGYDLYVDNHGRVAIFKQCCR